MKTNFLKHAYCLRKKTKKTCDVWRYLKCCRVSRVSFVCSSFSFDLIAHNQKKGSVWSFTWYCSLCLDCPCPPFDIICHFWKQQCLPYPQCGPFFCLLYNLIYVASLGSSSMVRLTNISMIGTKTANHEPYRLYGSGFVDPSTQPRECSKSPSMTSNQISWDMWPKAWVRLRQLS